MAEVRFKLPDLSLSSYPLNFASLSLCMQERPGPFWAYLGLTIEYLQDWGSRASGDECTQTHLQGHVCLSKACFLARLVNTILGGPEQGRIVADSHPSLLLIKVSIFFLTSPSTLIYPQP